MDLCRPYIDLKRSIDFGETVKVNLLESLITAVAN